MRTTIYAGMIAAMLAGCGGGDGGGSGSPAGAGTNVPAATDANTQAMVMQANMKLYLVGGAQPSLSRWTLPIPVKTSGDPRAAAALDAIESRLGKTLFDRSSIASLDDASITRGLVVSVGTSCAPQGTPIANNCGNVSVARGGCAVPVPASDRELNGRIYINLDSPDPAGCKASQSVTEHEFKHALGMYAHFDGFGIGAATSELSWRVLRTIYANPTGTQQSALVLAPAN